MKLESRKWNLLVSDRMRTNGDEDINKATEDCKILHPADYAAMVEAGTNPEMDQHVADLANTLRSPSDQALANSNPAKEASDKARKELYALATTLAEEQGISFPAALDRVSKRDPALANAAK